MRRRRGGLVIARLQPIGVVLGPVLLVALAALVAVPSGGGPRPLELALGEGPAPEPRRRLARLLLGAPTLLRPAVPSAPVEPAAAPPNDPPDPPLPIAPETLLAAPGPVEAGWPLDRLPLGAPLAPLVVASRFGPRPSPFSGLPSRHEGVDLVAPPGTPVRAAGAGTVRRAGRDGPFGLAVELDHGGGITTRYAHLARLLVAPGAVLAAGAPLGLVGSTGRSTGPHLHYEVRLAGTAVDPLSLLEAGRLLAAAREWPPADGLDGGPVQAHIPTGLGGEAEPPT